MAIADKLQSMKDSMEGFDINDIDPNNLGSLPLPVKLIIWVVLFVGVCFGGYKWQVEGQIQELKAEQREEVILKEQFAEKAHEAANLEAYRDQMKEMEQTFGALLSQLPKDTEVPDLLEDISSKGEQNGLDLKSLSLQSEVRGELFVELPIAIDLEGNYHDMGGFVSGISGLPRIVTLHNFSITAPKSGNTGNLDMKIIAKTYRYKGDDE